MTQIQMIQQMFNMQMILDQEIYSKHKTHYVEELTKLALIDELGELTHELKGDWCWWKSTQPPVDRAKVLEELVDCWHFALSLDYHRSYYEYCLVKDQEEIETFYFGHKFEISELILRVIKSDFTTKQMLKLTRRLDFTVAEVYDAYLKKNAVNFERLASGY